MLFRLVLFVCVAVSLSGHAVAGLVIRAEVTQAGHVLNGATIESSVSGDFTWEAPFGGSKAASRYAAFNSPWETTITGATGAGALWNGTYEYELTVNQPNVGIRVSHVTNQLYAVAAIGVLGDSFVPYWVDTVAQRSLTYRLTVSYDPLPVTGSPVVFNSIVAATLALTSHQAAGASHFNTPSSWTGTISSTAGAVPEPSSIALMGLGGIGLCVHRMRRKRKRTVA